jgi:hypothetical protein
MAARFALNSSELDLRYVALAILDHIMEESAFRPGVEYHEVVDVGQRAILRMYRGISKEKAIEVSRWVFDQLRNKTGRYGDFQVRYFDDRDGVHREHNFRYVENAFDPDDVN